MAINKTTKYITDPNTIPVDTSTGIDQLLPAALDDRAKLGLDNIFTGNNEFNTIPTVGGDALAKQIAVDAKLDKTSALGGTGQSWQDVTASRSLDVTYTNSTGRPICIAASCSIQISASATVVVNGSGIMVSSRSSSTGGTDTYVMTAIIPDGATYQITTNNTVTFNRWWELR